jgi:cohesin complex subunit SA-1/2
VGLARALNSCFAIRGAQLVVIKRLESERLVEVHINSISWIVERLSGHDVSTNRMAKRSLLFFRMLQQLLSTVDSRDVLKM